MGGINANCSFYDCFHSLLRFGILAWLLLASLSLQAYSLVYVHIGPDLPSYFITTIAQARLFNKECPIYVLASLEAIEAADPQYLDNDVTFVAFEMLPPSLAHQRFHNNPNHDWGGRGFWVFTSERFFYLEEFVTLYNLSEVFHFENDIMVYTDLNELMPTLSKYFLGMLGATFENDDRCVPGVLYISDPKPLSALIDFFPSCIDIRHTDMENLARFKDRYRGRYIDSLPTLLPAYAEDHELEMWEKNGHDPELYINHIDAFNSIFDAAAFGIYLGGMNSNWHADSAPGKISPYSVFDPSLFTIEWEKDDEGRRVPFILYKDDKLKINNLHITNKPQIPTFFSK